MHELPKYIDTAGKISVVTAILGVVVFAVVFLLNLGAKELVHVEAQSIATTSVTVLNTPPQWTFDAEESTESSTTTPTNSGDTVTWVATASDSNAEDYYLLICSGTSTPAPPTANAGAAPDCHSAQVQWAVSAAASSGVQASAATTTLDRSVNSDFAESNDWYAWICDAVATNPRCNASYRQGNATTASPFNVNSRPTFTAFADTSPGDPGATIVFQSTSTDADTDGANDTVQLWVCSTAAFTPGSGCDVTTLASSTFVAAHATATYTITIPTRDDTYGAYGYIVDNHNHAASGGSQGSDSVLVVNNVAPTVAAAQITLNDGNDITLTQNAGQTTGFTLQYTASDNNSCVNASAGDEIAGYEIGIYRSAISSSTCDGTTVGNYDPNNCYTSAVPTSVWNLSCTASSTSCTGATDSTMIFDCTFPLWYVADPTDGGSATTSIYFAQDWRAAVSPVDDDGATSSNHTESSIGQELLSFPYMSLNTVAIAYGPLEPGQFSSPLTASTTVTAEGNVGIDESLSGSDMCEYYTSAVSCNPSATSTIPAAEQVFATSSVAYGIASTSGDTLSSTTPTEFDINVLKPTATNTQTTGVTYWGIEVPSSITLAGSYTGENTFYVVQSDAGQWY